MVSQPQCPSAAVMIKSVKNNNDLIGNLTRDLTTFTAVLQLTTPPLTPLVTNGIENYNGLYEEIQPRISFWWVRVLCCHIRDPHLKTFRLRSRTDRVRNFDGVQPRLPTSETNRTIVSKVTFACRPGLCSTLFKHSLRTAQETNSALVVKRNC